MFTSARKNLVVLTLLLLIITQFLNYQVYWAFAFMLVVLSTYILRGKLPSVPIGLWGILVLTFAVYFYFYKQYNEVELFRYMTFLIGPPMFYYCGYVLIKDQKEQYFGLFVKIMLVLSLGGSFYSMACVINKYLKYGTYLSLIAKEGIVASMHGRYALDIWSNGLFQPTNLNSYCIFAIISLYPACRFVESAWMKRGFILSGILAILVCILSGSRTNLYFLVIGVVGGMLFSRKYKKSGGILKITKSKLVIGFIAIIVLLLFSDQLYEMLMNSTLGSRLSSQTLTISSDGRWERMGRVWTNLFEYPYGNMPFSEAHNLWLDTARVSGIAAMVLMIIFTVGSLTSAVRLYSICDDVPYKAWNLMAIMTMFLSFMIEPVLEGRPYIFILFCFIVGMSKAMEKQCEYGR